MTRSYIVYCRTYKIRQRVCVCCLCFFDTRHLFKLFHAIYIMCGYFKQAFSKLPFCCKEFFIYINDLTYYLSWWFLHSSFVMSKMRFGKFLLGFFNSFDCFPSISKHIWNAQTMRGFFVKTTKLSPSLSASSK